MKSYTDLEQSKKLAEILPLESADMHWQYIEEDNRQLQWFCFPKDFSINQHEYSCWSLAALLCVASTYCSRLNITLRADKKYNVFAVKDDFVFHSFDNHPDGLDNPVDGCVEIILKLYELKML